jgi:hypothetical protein
LFWQLTNLSRTWFIALSISSLPKCAMTQSEPVAGRENNQAQSASERSNSHHTSVAVAEHLALTHGRRHPYPNPKVKKWRKSVVSW